MSERYTIGPFRFTFHNGRVWWRYQTQHFGDRIRATGATSHSLGRQLQAFLQAPQGERGAYAADGLKAFVGYFMTQFPGADHWADHYTRAGIPAKLESRS